MLSAAAMDEVDFIPGTVERRDLETRAERDRLAHLLGVPAGQLRHICRETAKAMIATIVREAQHASLGCGSPET